MVKEKKWDATMFSLETSSSVKNHFCSYALFSSNNNLYKICSKSYIQFNLAMLTILKGKKHPQIKLQRF